MTNPAADDRSPAALARSATCGLGDCPQASVFDTGRCLQHQDAVPRPEEHECEWVSAQPFAGGLVFETCRRCPARRAELTIDVKVPLYSLAEHVQIERSAVEAIMPTSTLAAASEAINQAAARALERIFR